MFPALRVIPVVESLESRRLLAAVPPGFADAVFEDGLTAPTSMAFAPDGRLFVTQQGGQVRVVKGGQLLANSFTTVTTENLGERGLLGLAFDPAFTTNRHVYVYYTVPSTPRHNRVSRFTAVQNADGTIGDTAAAGSERVIVELDNLGSATNHNGGAIHFGPDGKLYVAVGDAGNSANAQSLSTRHGKVLRLNKDGTIPTDNPFYNSASGDNRSVWARGLRNPFTFSFKPGSSKMFINDVGQLSFEEINDGAAGRNYGWPATEGPFNPSQFPDFSNPVYSYARGSGPAQGFAITGGVFYNPPAAAAQFPSSHVGDYFFADFGAGWIRTLDPIAMNATADFATGVNRPVDLDVGPDGALYYLERGAGRVGRISYTAGGTARIDFEAATLGTISSGSYTEDGITFANLPGRGGSAVEPLQVLGAPQGFASKVLQPTNYGRRLAIGEQDGSTFDLARFDYGAGRWGEAGDFVVTGRFAGGGILTKTVSFSTKKLTTLTLNWTNLVGVDVNFAGGNNDVYGVVDNVVVGNAGGGGGGGGNGEAVVDIEPAPLGPIASGTYAEDGYTFANLPGRTGSTTEALQVLGTPHGYASKVLQTSSWGRRIAVARQGGSSFGLRSFAYGAGRWGEAGDFVLTGRFANGSLQTRNVSFNTKQLSTLTLDWQDLTSVDVNFAGGSNDAYGALDNFVFGQ